MYKRVLWLPILVLMAAVAVLAGLAVGTVDAAPPTPVQVEEGLRIEADKMQELSAFAKRSEAYLTKRADGTLDFRATDAAALGVSDQFLADYKAALEAINVEIRAGRFQEQADGTLKVNVDAGAAPAQAAPAVRLPAGAQLVDNPSADQLAAARPAIAAAGIDDGLDWSVCNCNNSFYVNWSYNDNYYYRYSPYYYTWPAAMSAHVGYPYIAPRLTYLFSYSHNHYYFTQCTYSYGTYWYIPWNYLCYGCNYGYHPVYFYSRYVYIYYGRYYYFYSWRPYTLYY